MSEDFLHTMAQASAARVVEARAALDEATLRERAFSSPPPPRLRMHDDGFDIIAEIKLTSPAAGVLASADTAIGERALAYAGAGAAAVSVLTEPTRFDGHLEHLREAAAALASTPTVAMRKDFLVDAYQLYEARLAGAGGALLIVRMLDDARLRELLDVAAECGLFVLLEAFDEDDLQRAAPLLSNPAAADAPPVLLGLNSRDLRTLAVDEGRFARCIDAFPSGVPAVAESGLESLADVARIAGLGYRWALIGSALMRDASPAVMLRQMLDAGRHAARGSGS
ncbi:MAG: indole-3-glycerol-phosphate synthase [Pseudomonadota bacterium]